LFEKNSSEFIGYDRPERMIAAISRLLRDGKRTTKKSFVARRFWVFRTFAHVTTFKALG
jgi:hypothetical protein